MTFASTAGGNSLLASGTSQVIDHGTGNKITLTGNANPVSTSTTTTPVALFGRSDSLVVVGILYAYGSDNVVNAVGADTVILNGTDNLVTDNGLGVAFAGGSGASMVASNTALVVAGGSGTSDMATLQGGATDLALGSTSVTATGTNMVLPTGSNNAATINASSTVVNYTGANTATASGGTVFNGGRLTFIGSGIVEPGAGSVTAHASGGNLDVFGGSGGNNLLVGGSGSNTLLGGDGGDTLLGGSGANVFVGGPGSATMTGGANATLNTLEFAAQRDNQSSDVIINFNIAADKIELLSGLAVNQQSVSHGNLSVMLSNNTKLTLIGVGTTLSATTSGTTTTLV